MITAVMGQVAAPLSAAERRLAKDQQAQAKILAAQQEELRLSEVTTTTTLESDIFEYAPVLVVVIARSDGTDSNRFHAPIVADNHQNSLSVEMPIPFFQNVFLENHGHVLGFLDGLLMMVLWAGAGAADEAASDLQECPRARAPGGARARLTGRLIGAQSELRNIMNVVSNFS